MTVVTFHAALFKFDSSLRCDTKARTCQLSVENHRAGRNARPLRFLAGSWIRFSFQFVGFAVDAVLLLLLLPPHIYPPCCKPSALDLGRVWAAKLRVTGFYLQIAAVLKPNLLRLHVRPQHCAVAVQGLPLGTHCSGWVKWAAGINERLLPPH